MMISAAREKMILMFIYVLTAKSQEKEEANKRKQHP